MLSSISVISVHIKLYQPYSKTERIDLVISVRIIHILVLNILIRFL